MPGRMNAVALRRQKLERRGARAHEPSLKRRRRRTEHHILGLQLGARVHKCRSTRYAVNEKARARRTGFGREVKDAMGLEAACRAGSGVEALASAVGACGGAPLLARQNLPCARHVS
eukprot:4517679-Prymnesium_polylepis.2